MSEFPNRFEVIWAKTLGSEGVKYLKGTNVPEGATSPGGISARSQTGWMRSRVESNLLTLFDAKAIAYVQYYLPIPAIEDLPMGFAYLIFDMRFHGWDKTLFVEIQRALNSVTGSSLKLDGIYGPFTARIIIDLGPQQRATVYYLIEEAFKRSGKSMGQRVDARYRAAGNTVSRAQGIENRYQTRFETAKAFDAVPPKKQDDHPTVASNQRKIEVKVS